MKKVDWHGNAIPLRHSMFDHMGDLRAATATLPSKRYAHQLGSIFADVAVALESGNERSYSAADDVVSSFIMMILTQSANCNLFL